MSPFEECISKLEDKATAKVLAVFWRRLKAELPDLPEPAAMPLEDGGVQMCWDKGEFHFEIDIFANETYEWFYRNRFINSYQGGELSVYFFPAEMLTRLQLLCPPEPENDLC